VNAQQSKWKRQLWLTVGGVVVAMLGAAVFTLGSLKIPLHPEQDNAFLILFALSTFIAAALLVFSLILARNVLRLWAERRSGQMGSRFKMKMVAGAMGVSLLPVVFLFFFSYAIVNRTLALWFPRPLEIANEQSQILLDEMSSRGHARLSQEAQAACSFMRRPNANGSEALKASPGADALWSVAPNGEVSEVASLEPASTGSKGVPKLVRTVRSGAEVWVAANATYLAGRAPCGTSFMIAGRLAPTDYLDHYNQIEAEMETYGQQKQRLHAYKREIVLALLLITLLLLFATTWVALFLSKQVTIPIQALAEGTREISRGNFDHRVDVQGQDELGTLVRSFNRMTEQLGEGRKQINEFTRSLEQAVEERERRGKLMEAILENIPTGVVSLDSSGNIASVNTAVATILGEHARNAHSLSELLGDEAARAVLHLMRQSLRMGTASREIEVAAGGQLVRAAVTVTSLGPRRSNPGFIIVVDDLTDLLRAQKAAAWQEVAQRIAHEIKNPLTPIQLSVERMLRQLDRTSQANPGSSFTDFQQIAAECATLIGREVRTLKSLVDEFSQFARFPAARLAPSDVNQVVSSALALFQGRLEGITVRTNLASSLPPIKADSELLRRVVANLIDNAAEAMEGSTIRQLAIATRAESDDDAVVIEISDSGHGISPQDKQRLFLPHFSTKDRGTGLGLAIASRIVAEHNGSIRVEDNLPMGSKFVIRFPALEVMTTHQAGNPAA
jgi:two-component system, NtrC family, nitrogen regulation sensor histidine kinase NtrY